MNGWHHSRRRHTPCPAALAGAARDDTIQDARHETGEADIAGEELAHHLQHAGAAADRAGDNLVHVSGLDSLDDGLDSLGDEGCSLVRALRIDGAGRGGDRELTGRDETPVRGFGDALADVVKERWDAENLAEERGGDDEGGGCLVPAVRDRRGRGLEAQGRREAA